MKEIKTRTKIKIPFFDLDPMNVVWHGNYVKYIEIARCDFFKKIEYSYDDMKKDGVMYPVAKMDFKFIKSARFNDEIEVETILKELEPAIIFKYTIFHNGKKILCANTMQIGVSIETGESLFEAPKKLKKAIDEFIE